MSYFTKDKEYICYETNGSPQNPAMILIMGLGGQLIDWPELLIEYLEKHFYVIRMDNRDSGLSYRYDKISIPDFEEMRNGNPLKPPYTLYDMAEDVIKVMDDLNLPKAHIVGTSMGGIVAQLFAFHYPDRILSLTCIGTTSGDPHLPPPQQEILDFFSSSMNQKNQSIADQMNKKLKLFKLYNPVFFNEEKTKEKLKKSFQRADYPDGFKRLTLAMVSTEPRTTLLKMIFTPSLIIQGALDPVFSIEHGKQLAEYLPNSHLEMIKDMGHGMPDQLCEEIAEIIIRHCNQCAGDKA